MTTQFAVDYCTQLQDKYGSPNVLSDEWVNYLNHATNEWLNRIIPDEAPVQIGYETDKDVITNVQPLIFTLTIPTDANGLITDVAINTALVAAGAEAGAQYLRILALGTSGGTPVKYVRQNNLYEYTSSFFKKPTLASPKYTLVHNGLQVYPPIPSPAMTLSVIKKPVILSLSPVVDFEFDNYVCYKIIVIALQLAGIATRDEEVLQDVRMAGIEGK